jgi:hypothetical protein
MAQRMILELSGLPKCAPIIMAIYYTSDAKGAVKREDVVSATQLLINKLAQSDQCIRKNIERVKNEITNTTKST